MGLELGSPWLVLAETEAPGAAPSIIFRDNFTGAGFRRVIKARKHEPASFAAVMDARGRLAQNMDGSLYDPIEQTKGRHSGTDADRAYRAQLTATALFKVMDGVPEDAAFRPQPSPMTVFMRSFVWAAGILVLLLVLLDIAK